MVLRRMFGHKRDEVTREWRKLHNEEFNDMYCSPDIVWVIKSRRLRWVVHVVRIGERKGVYRVMGKPEALRQRDSLKDSDVDGCIILRLLFWKRDVGVWTLCRVFIHIFLSQTMSLSNTMFQLLCRYFLWCPYH
jgi:hypothetical protein